MKSLWTVVFLAFISLRISRTDCMSLWPWTAPRRDERAEALSTPLTTWPFVSDLLEAENLPDFPGTWWVLLIFRIRKVFSQGRFSLHIRVCVLFHFLKGPIYFQIISSLPFFHLSYLLIALFILNQGFLLIIQLPVLWVQFSAIYNISLVLS